MNYLLLIIGWAVYLSLHSLLASEPIKLRIMQTCALNTTRYRLMYSSIATIGLAALIYLIFRMDEPLLFIPPLLLQVVAVICTLAGAVIFYAAFRQYSFTAFLGLSSELQTTLKTNGILNYVRHPLYSATLLWLLAYVLLIPNVPALISAACILIYLPIGIKLEERKLIRQFGAAYEAYRQRVPAVLPHLPSVF
ncbi:MAG: isoprenylcysteine carboxylmethyltransferase family protein [Cyclobacteriaceae bacterium]|nr:isoprenylcysteine carboxylmethyltransferase family protein [Cyclobacteriaceae bacterium]MDW8331968.1 isoprenylcysteine carboxylmethyltransferase family protein [Cyclobacteriaceae bacterium]